MSADHLPTDPEEFWNIYLNEHRSVANRWLHVLGTVASWAIFVTAFVIQNYWVILLAPLVGYLFAWTGHLFVEKNKPLTLNAPFRSLKCDYRLTFLTLIGQSPKTNLTVANNEEEESRGD
jgi:hypothetical protein